VACEGLPTLDCDIDVGRVDLDGIAGAAGHLRRNDRRARPAEGSFFGPGAAFPLAALGSFFGHQSNR
jgi:hypothetical protein